jgi:hypothetical protein
MLFIATFGAPSGKGLDLVRILVEAPVEVLLRIGLEKKGIGVAHDGKHGGRRRPKGDTDHELNKNVKDSKYALRDRSVKEGGCSPSPSGLIAAP